MRIRILMTHRKIVLAEIADVGQPRYSHETAAVGGRGYNKLV